MTVKERLRANLNRELAEHCCRTGAGLTITTLAEKAELTRNTVGRLGGHATINTLRKIAGTLGCNVSHLVTDVEPLHRPRGSGNE